MKIEREITILSGFLGFTIGVCGMLFVNVDQKQRMFERDIQLDSDTKFLIQENIGTCEDMIEWMNYDDSTGNEMYIYNLNNMVDHNRSILYKTSVEGLDLQTEYDY
jgi:hypothetical protein|tara:strand:+ start:300 stop:617 length:318 start_codon:yes stop_codon:yes gene_type:complete